MGPPLIPTIIVGVYFVLGAMLSYGFGRTPGTVNVEELRFTAVVLAAFFVYYSAYDVMAVGAARRRTNTFGRKTPPDELDCAMRVQANQVEQFVPFVGSSILFSLFVNGQVGGLLAATWAVLRAMYAVKYRASVGIDFLSKGLTAYTIPCYFIVNTMSTAIIVHIVRSL